MWRAVAPVMILLLWFLPTWAGEGWYLLLPPTLRTPNGIVVDPSRPLREWTHASAYDSSRVCEAALAGLSEGVWRAADAEIQRAKETPRYKTHPDYQVAIRMSDTFTHARCIAATDPRLR